MVSVYFDDVMVNRIDLGRFQVYAKTSEEAKERVKVLFGRSGIKIRMIEYAPERYL